MNEPVTFKQAFKSYWENSFNIKGRARSSEVWWMVLGNFLMLLPIPLYIIFIPLLIFTMGMMDDSLDYTLLKTLGLLVFYIYAYIIITFIPNLSLILRRFHDIGQHGIIQICFFTLTFILNSGLVFYILGSGINKINHYTMISNETRFDNMLFFEAFMTVAQCLTFIMFIYFIVIACLDSKKGRNKYGESTKYPSAQYGDDSKLSIF